MIRLAMLLASWYDQRLEGWYYFQEPEEEIVEEASALLAEKQAELQQLLDQAILSPTEEHIAAYLTAYRQATKQSALFAEAWGAASCSLKERYFLLLAAQESDPAFQQAAQAGDDFMKQTGWTVRKLTAKDQGLKALLPETSAPTFYLIDMQEHTALSLGAPASAEELLQAVREAAS